MSDVIIRAENLGKKYIIGHQRSQQGRYVTLRDIMSQQAKSLLHWFNPFKSNDSLKPSSSDREEFWALKDVSFEIKQGDVVGIIGRNGAGKSTLLKILSRITEPTTGRVTIKGRVASLLEVGTGFHNELTGRENIFLNGAILGMTKAEIHKKFDEIVAFAEVEKFIDTPVKHYSSGMYVRLAFAVAAHLEPEILIVDEVLAVGDIAFQKKCLGKMNDVANQDGKTVLFVSHSMSTIQNLCNQGIFLKKGTIELNDKINAVINSYIQDDIEIKPSYLISPSSYHESIAYAHKLQIEDENANPVRSVAIGQPWQIRLFLTVTQKIENLVIALGFLTRLGSPLRTTWSHPQTLDRGEYEAVFSERSLILSPGNYPIIVGLSVYGTNIQYVEDIGFLSINNFVDNDIDANFVRTSNSGLILNPLNFAICKV